MSSRKDLAETIRELIRQVASNDPQSRQLALIEQLLNAFISDFAALTAALAEYASSSAQRIAALQKELEETQRTNAPNTIIRRREGLTSPNRDPV